MRRAGAAPAARGRAVEHQVDDDRPQDRFAAVSRLRRAEREAAQGEPQPEQHAVDELEPPGLRSTGIRSRPWAPPRTVRSGAGARARATSRAAPTACRRDGAAPTAAPRTAPRTASGWPVARAGRPGCACRPGVGRDVAQVVERRASRRPARRRARATSDSGPVTRPACEYACRITATRPKKTKTEISPSPRSRTGADRRCRTRPRRRRRHRPRPATSAGERREHEPGDTRPAEGSERRRTSPPGRRGPRPDQAERADALVVGAADAVAVVVGVVDADLQGQRDEQRPAARQATAPSPAAATPVPTKTGDRAAGRVRGRAPATHCADVATRCSLTRASRPGPPGPACRRPAAAGGQYVQPRVRAAGPAPRPAWRRARRGWGAGPAAHDREPDPGAPLGVRRRRRPPRDAGRPGDGSRRRQEHVLAAADHDVVGPSETCRTPSPSTGPRSEVRNRAPSRKHPR